MNNDLILQKSQKLTRTNKRGVISIKIGVCKICNTRQKFVKTFVWLCNKNVMPLLR